VLAAAILSFLRGLPASHLKGFAALWALQNYSPEVCCQALLARKPQSIRASPGPSPLPWPPHATSSSAEMAAMLSVKGNLLICQGTSLDQLPPESQSR